jgi:hypothetical protein
VHHDDPDVFRKLDQINLFDNPPTGLAQLNDFQDLRSYCDHCHKFIVIASVAKQSRSTQNTDCNGLLRRLRRLAMTTCLAHFVMEITQVRKSCPTFLLQF